MIVLGFDGLDPRICEQLWQQGRLPHFARLRDEGWAGRVATTYPAQTPVAWSTFATGLNPGGHGIFDFLGRNPATYLPRVALNRYEQKNAFLPPRVVNARQGRPVWDTLAQAGMPSTVLRCPCTYPPGESAGRLLAGMGVPDLRGSFGIPSFFAEGTPSAAPESENLLPLSAGADGRYLTHLPGVLHPTTRRPCEFPLMLELLPGERTLRIRSDGQPKALEVAEGQWSDWLKVKFKPGLLQSAPGMVRFYLMHAQPLALYASPVHFDPAAPLFPISAPPRYAAELEAALGTFYTAGMVEEHTGLINGRIDEEAFLAQCALAWREREAMLRHELGRLDAGLLYCLFDTPDRVQHMFWRFGEPDHPANAVQGGGDYAGVIDDWYARCDALTGSIADSLDERTLLIVLSDHGFGSFRRGINLNTWLYEQGLLALKSDAQPGPGAGDMLRGIDWNRTKAYALGMGGIYLNLAGREANGIVSPAEAEEVKRALAAALAGLPDPQNGVAAVTRVLSREALYQGPCAGEAPDLLVNCADGYRASWDTAMGGVPAELFEDNTRRWGGDHVQDPALVPGVLLLNRAVEAPGASLTDMAPTILRALGAPDDPALEGKALFS
ncbi:MAG TPA: alkaline phosphatase family protein [Armatimonadota bacterium]